MAHHYFRIVILGLALAASGLMPGVARAGCKADCEDDYDSAESDCLLLYDDPDGADDLRACIDDARSDYEDCEDECNS